MSTSWSALTRPGHASSAASMSRVAGRRYRYPPMHPNRSAATAQEHETPRLLLVPPRPGPDDPSETTQPNSPPEPSPPAVDRKPSLVPDLLPPKHSGPSPLGFTARALLFA